jgi:hypothetical protein
VDDLRRGGPKGMLSSILYSLGSFAQQSGSAGGRFESRVSLDSWSAYAQQNRLSGRGGLSCFQVQLIGNRLLDDGALEESRIVTRVQP